MPRLARSFVLATLSLTTALSLGAQAPAIHGKRNARLIIRNALVVDGMGTPASGPYDIVIDNNRFSQIVPSGGDAIQNAIARAAKTLKNLDWFEVVETRGHLKDGKILHYQVKLQVGFRLE